MPYGSSVFRRMMPQNRAQGGNSMTRFSRLSVLTTASLFALSLGVGAALAAGEPDPPGARNPGPSSTQKPASGQKESTGTKKKQKKYEQEFLDQYRALYALKQDGN